MTQYNSNLELLKTVYDIAEQIKGDNNLTPFLIAGGFLRDLCLTDIGVIKDAALLPHDLDVFISTPTDDELSDDIPWLYAEKIAIALGVDPVTAIGTAVDEDKYAKGKATPKQPKLSNVINVYLDERHNWAVVQVIGVNDGDFSDPLAYVEKEFDIGACMCYYDGTRIKASKYAREDFVKKDFTIINDSPGSKDRQADFMQRFYPEAYAKLNDKKKASLDDWGRVLNPAGLKIGEFKWEVVYDNANGDPLPVR